MLPSAVRYYGPQHVPPIMLNCHGGVEKSWQQPSGMRQTAEHTPTWRPHLTSALIELRVSVAVSGRVSQRVSDAPPLPKTQKTNQTWWDVKKERRIRKLFKSIEVTWQVTTAVNKTRRQPTSLILREQTVIVLPLYATGVIYFKWSPYCPHTSKIK